MPSKQEDNRERIVQFYLRHKSKGKKYTIDYFIEEEWIKIQFISHSKGMSAGGQ